jgi:hypothetical protein
MDMYWHEDGSETLPELSTLLQSQRSYVLLNIEARICGAVSTLHMSGTAVQIEQTGGCALHLAPNLKYNAY